MLSVSASNGRTSTAGSIVAIDGIASATSSRVAANVDASPASYTWAVDTVAPTSTVSFPASAGTYNTTGWNTGCGTSGFCGTYSDGTGSGVTYDDLVTRSGMRGIARYADSVGLCKDRMIPRQVDGTLGAPTDAIANAHRAGLTVTGWTFRRENSFLPAEYRSSADPAGIGDLAGEIRRFLDAGMDDFFTDDPDVGAAVADARQ